MNDDARSHQAVWALLPWLANGSATPEQRRQAAAHLRRCASCRAELARERELARGLAQPPATGPDMERGLQHLMQRLDHAADTPPLPSPGRARLLAGTRVRIGTVAALGLAELLVLLLAGWWWLRMPAPADGAPAPYRTLTQREPGTTDGPRWRVVFQAQQTVHELQALLREQGLVIVAGPTEAGVFTLGPAAAGSGPAPDADALAARLRQSPRVLFAEALPRKDPR